jgi:excisionase family DNA binding protein
MNQKRGLRMKDNKWLSMKEVCAYLGISRDTVMNWMKKEGMPAHQKGRLWRFDINEIDEWMRNNESQHQE